MSVYTAAELTAVLGVDLPVVLDVEGDARTVALAWAHAAHNVAGAFWPAAFGYVAARSTAARRAADWLRSIGIETDGLMDRLIDAEKEAGLFVAGPRFPAWWQTEAGLYVEWDTSVSLILGPAENPANLRLVLAGEHAVRERLVREALEDKVRAARACTQAWCDIVAPVKRALDLCDNNPA